MFINCEFNSDLHKISTESLEFEKTHEKFCDIILRASKFMLNSFLRTVFFGPQCMFHFYPIKSHRVNRSFLTLLLGEEFFRKGKVCRKSAETVRLQETSSPVNEVKNLVFHAVSPSEEPHLTLPP